MPEESMEIQQQEDVLPQSNFKTSFVEKAVPLEFDDGCLLAVDTANVLEVKKGEDREELIKSLSRDNTQLLINRLWQLPTERVETVVVATLPARTTALPREKPIPKAKAPTRWQEYRKVKGIQARKKDKMVWDETAKEFRPRWGYKRANDDSANNWAIELPPNADMSEDPFEKMQSQKKERVAKNELQRLRNIARAEKLQIPFQPQQQQSTDGLTKTFHQVTKSTASLGKFVDKVRDEPRDRRSGKKQKFESNLVDPKTERDRQMRILDEIASKRPILDTDKAAARQVNAEKREKRTEDKGAKKNGGRKNQRQWIPPEKYARMQKRDAERDAKNGGGKKERKNGKKHPGGKAKTGGKGASKTRSMLKRSK